MLRVGLTGGLASGKSTVARMFAARGAQVLLADELAHELMAPGKPVYDAVVRHFGKEIVQADGCIDRGKLAQKAFGEKRVDELNKLVHPAVISAQEAWLREVAGRAPKAVAVIEAALLMEAGVSGHFDKMVVVTCSPQQRVQRFAARAGMAAEEARQEVDRRMAAQWADEEKVKLADYVIRNDGELAETERQVDAIFTELQALAAGAGQNAGAKRF